jgi:hypothetical protein
MMMMRHGNAATATDAKMNVSPSIDIDAWFDHKYRRKKKQAPRYLLFLLMLNWGFVLYIGGHARSAGRGSPGTVVRNASLKAD